jgi:hypothetical protein
MISSRYGDIAEASHGHLHGGTVGMHSAFGLRTPTSSAARFWALRVRWRSYRYPIEVLGPTVSARLCVGSGWAMANLPTR